MSMFPTKKPLYATSWILLLLFIFTASGFAEEIQVSVKGIAKGTKNRQRDYKTAVLDAKIKAIEQAGADIESLTQIRNYQVKEKTVEAKSKGVILPGYKIEDIGYVADGTYQIMLIGKIQVGEGTGIKGKEIGRDDRFIAYGNGTVLDTKTNLMWAAKDNGSDISWPRAEKYCEKYRVGGYSDWRMPTENELYELLDTNEYNKPCDGCSYNIITPYIYLSACCIWTFESSGEEAGFINFNIRLVHKNYTEASTNQRALPVRNAN
jgi:hypothetical protein